jgi:transketolase
MTLGFAKKYPDRHFELGIAEANMIGTAAGLALAGKIPVLTSFACFVVGRFETVRISVAYNEANVKIVGTHAGLGIGEDGYTQMGLEDVACLRSLPNFTILQPADAAETHQALQWALTHSGPVYMRLTRQDLPPVHAASGYRFEMGKAEELRPGNEAALFATGGCVHNALLAAELLARKGISASVSNFGTLMPADSRHILEAGARARMIATVEDHSPRGGLGSAVAETLAEGACKARLIRLGAKGFGESGKASDLYRKHGLDPESIAATVEQALKR